MMKILFEIDRDLLEAGATMDEGAFLAGPGRDTDDIVIDDLFSTRLDSLLCDMRKDLGLTTVTQAMIRSWPLLCQGEGWAIRQPLDDKGFPGAGITLHDAADCGIIGGYLGCSLVIDPAFRGRGHGARLVALRYLLEGGLPLWQHDTPGYSRGGYQCHLKARDLLFDIKNE